MATRQYTDAELNQIEASIIAASKKVEDKTIEFGGGKTVKNDWNDDGFIQDMYDQFLQAVQQEKSDKRTKEQFDVNTTFEGYLRAALDTLKWRREELKRELDSGSIDLRIYNNGKMTIELAEGAIKKYLERTETARLVGV